MHEKIEILRQRREKARGMGGPEAVARQHAAGKLTARERLDLLLDPGSFVELGVLAHHRSEHPDMKNRETPADGVVTGFGRIDGRPVAVAAYDFTVMAGSMGQSGERKVARLREQALAQRVPMIWLLDSAGARIQETTGSQFAVAGELFYDQVVMSGVVPQVAAMLGPCAAGTAYIPALADFVPMVRGTSSMALGGPHLIKAAIGEDVTAEELGGSKVHCEISGCGDLQCDDDPDCIAAVRRFLSYLPSHNRAAAPHLPWDAPPGEADLRPALAGMVPANPRAVYDVRKVIAEISDPDSWFELKPDFARNLVVGFARFHGEPVGVVANQPKVMGGALDNNAADKACRFVRLCDAFNVPLLFLQDVPGFLVGSAVEKAGIIRHGAKLLYAVSEATVPKVTVVLRKAYGAGYFVMCGKGYHPDCIVAWPTAEISVMGPEGAVNIIFRKQIAASSDPEGTRAALVQGFREVIDPYIAAQEAFIDDIIDPAETRLVVVRTLQRCGGNRAERPWRKHGVMPV